MKNHLQRILSLLCVLALVLGCASAFAEDPQKQSVTHVITLVWEDNNNYDGIRPASFSATFAQKTVVLNEDNGWTDGVTVAEDVTGSWAFDGIDGYDRPQNVVENADHVTTLYLRHDIPAPVSVTTHVTWEDSDNKGKIRPDKVKLILYADGEPYGEPVEALSPAYKAEWNNLPARKPNSSFNIAYTVRALDNVNGYTVDEQGQSVKFVLETGTLNLNVAVSGQPEGADLSALSVRVDGPDPTMPRTLSWSELSSGSYNFGAVLPGAYLVMGTAPEIEGYTMDTANSKVSDAVYVKPGENGTLQYKYAYKLPEPIENVDPDYDPEANLGNLTFEIYGPDALTTPLTVTYAQFTNGKYELPKSLVPGKYTVVEKNAETLVNYYVLDIDSITGAMIQVKNNETTVARLYNKYTPAPTPEPDAEFVDVPVTKTWSDNNNKDGNRPESVTVRLYADGVEVASHVLTAAENWNFTFTDLPRYQEDNKTEIVYTVNEDAVPMYSVQINGYNLVNIYQPEVTSLSVAKRWNDNNNAANKRPKSIFMTLTRDNEIIKVVELNDANGWTQTVDNLPVTVNGQRASYTWTEQRVLNYFMEDVEQTGSAVVFTNKYFVPEKTIGGPQKKTTEAQYTLIGDYETALGMDVIINHVGDCFD